VTVATAAGRRAPALAKPCDHCGLPVRSAARERVIEGEPRSFCCVGCGIAWRLAGRGGRDGGSESSAFLARVGLGVVLSMLIMLVAWVPYLDPGAAADPTYRAAAPWAMLAAATPVLLLLGVPYLWNAATDLRRGRVGADLLIGLGILAAYAASVVSLVSGRPDALYLDTAAGLATLVTVGRWLEATAKERASRRLREFLTEDERPATRVTTATVGGESREDRVRASDLAPGDLVRVRPGEKVPADGRVREGRALLDEAALSGEPAPRPVGPGDAVAAPAIPLDGPLLVEVERTGGETLLGRVAAVLARARAERSPLERAADRVSAVFVPGVVALALAVAGLDVARGAAAADAALHALSILVVACPCALGIATPLAVTAAIGRLAERGVLVRSGAALSDLPRVRVVAFDKTGTLTAGVPRVVTGEPAALALAAAVEAGSEHALARGILAAGNGLAARAPAATDVRVVPGRGVEGLVGGTRVRVGSPRWIESDERPADAGRLTQVLVEADGRVVGRLALEDPLRPSARPAVAALVAEGVEVAVVSGDSPGATAAAAAALGLPPGAARGGCLPAEKVEAVATLRAEAAPGAVAFVGDGLNDAPALAAADLSIAVGSGTDLARETASVSLLGDDLTRVAALLRVARRTRAAVRWNLFWAFAYNVAGIGLAVASRLPPVFAALAMVASSLLVIANSARLRAALPRDLAPSPRDSAPVSAGAAASV
jgi:heavy metal translocating P-type ATPase